MKFQVIKNIWPLCEKLPLTDGGGFPGFSSSMDKVSIKCPGCLNDNAFWEKGFTQIDETLRREVDCATNAFHVWPKPYVQNAYSDYICSSCGSLVRLCMESLHSSAQGGSAFYMKNMWLALNGNTTGPL